MCLFVVSKHKTRRRKNSQQHRRWILHVALESLQPQRTHRAVDDTVVRRKRCDHRARLRKATILGGHHLLRRRSNSQDTSLRRINDGRELPDVVHAEVRDGERSTVIFTGLQLAVARLAGELLHSRGNSLETQLVRIAHHRHEQAVLRLHCDGHVHAAVLLDVIAVPARVHLRHVAQRQTCSLDDHVVHAHLRRRLLRLRVCHGVVQHSAHLH
mmetsp:Transcript_1279/g.2842  ORF Transcript_1279/g.2842 Transcript_1279/m.2842 type:complete len:213 (+) Transcript_1279:145-783(+)